MKQQPLLKCTRQETHAAFRKLAEQDRDVMEKGVKAFVSFVRAYKEHQCRFIFRLADLRLEQLGTALGLLRLPKMPEMRKSKQGTGEFVPSPVDPNNVKVGRQLRPLFVLPVCTVKSLVADQGARHQAVF